MEHTVPTHREIFSESSKSNPNLDCDYSFPVDLVSVSKLRVQTIIIATLVNLLILAFFYTILTDHLSNKEHSIP